MSVLIGKEILWATWLKEAPGWAKFHDDRPITLTLKADGYDLMIADNFKGTIGKQGRSL